MSTSTKDRQQTAAPHSGWLRSRLYFLIKLLLSAALFWIIFSSIDVSDLRSRLLQVSFGTVVLVAICFALHIVLSAARWRTIVMALEGAVPFQSVLLATLLERFVNQAVPSPLAGDGARAVALIRNGESVRVAAYSIVVDRVFAIGGIVGLVTLGAPFSLSTLRTPSIVAAVWLITVFTLAGVAFLALCPRAVWMRLDRARLLRYPAEAALMLRRVLLAPRAFVLVAGVSLIAQMIPILCFLLIAYDLNIALKPLDAFILVPLIVAASLVPISIAGWGIREGAAILVLAEIGTSAPDAVALSIVFGLINAGTACVGGLIWLATSRDSGQA